MKAISSLFIKSKSSNAPIVLFVTANLFHEGISESFECLAKFLALRTYPQRLGTFGGLLAAWLKLDIRIFPRRDVSNREFSAAKNVSWERDARKIAGLKCRCIGQLSVGEYPDDASKKPAKTKNKILWVPWEI